MTRVKICGITRPEDGRAAAEAGAWAIGLVFSPKSPRFVTARQALAVIDALPKGVLRVGVFLNQSMAVIRRVEAEVPLDLIQLHGSESDEQCRAVGKERCIKAVALRDEESVERARKCSADILLADRPRSVGPAGDSQEARWKLTEELARKRPKTLLAGGLAENAADAIRVVKPWGLDASSGLEISAGVKDPKLIRAFLDAVRQADGENL